jgi:cytochrome b561
MKLSATATPGSRRSFGKLGAAAAPPAATAPACAAVEQRSAHHSPWTIALHWGSALLLLLAVAAILLHQRTEDTALRALLMQLHRQAGLAVLLALAWRLALRMRVGLADHSGGMPLALHLAAQAAHMALYGVLLAVPMLGWASASAHGVQLHLFGVLPLPALVADDPDLADLLSDWHLWSAWTMLGLVLMHVAAALWHHLARRDGVLAAMLPLLRRPG